MPGVIDMTRGLSKREQIERILGYSRNNKNKRREMSASRGHIFHSTRTKKGWEVREGGEPISRHPNQRECERAAITAARQDWEERRLLTRAILHKRDGTIRVTRTYGLKVFGP